MNLMQFEALENALIIKFQVPRGVMFFKVWQYTELKRSYKMSSFVSERHRWAVVG